MESSRAPGSKAPGKFLDHKERSDEELRASSRRYH